MVHAGVPGQVVQGSYATGNEEPGNSFGPAQTALLPMKSLAAAAPVIVISSEIEVVHRLAGSFQGGSCSSFGDVWLLSSSAPTCV